MVKKNLNHITLKKPIYSVSPDLEEYLEEFSRRDKLPVSYEQLLCFSDLFPVYDKFGEDTLWKSAIYEQSEFTSIIKGLVEIYNLLKSDGVPTAHLKVGSIDFCSFGNTQPFRIKIINQLNDNYDFFYIKRADASRIYGLELEDILSPNKINFIFYNDTLVEDHIIGIPGDQFLIKNIKNPQFNKVRLAKEFVKFNERCFVRLLGDMRAYNYVIVVTQDFDQVQYRIRAIDFDQQSYEGKMRIYMPQFYKENLPFVKLAMECLTIESTKQYQQEERSLLRKRYLSSRYQIQELIKVMQKSPISTDAHIAELRNGLSRYYHLHKFNSCKSMGEILNVSLNRLT